MAAIAADGRARKHRFASVGCSPGVAGAVAAAAAVVAPVAVGGRGRKASAPQLGALCVVVSFCFVFACCLLCLCCFVLVCFVLIVCSFAVGLFCFVVLCSGGGHASRPELSSQSMRIS